MHALTQWRHYLLGQETRVFTDNSAVKWLKTHEKLSPRQVRWLDKIEEYNLVISHIPGVQNTAADALSRLDIAPVMIAPELDDWSSAYRDDPALYPDYLLEGLVPVD